LDQQVKPTRIATLVSNLIATGILAWGFSELLVRLGAQLPVSTTNLLVTLPVIAIVLVLLALPIFRYRAAIISALDKPADSKQAAIKRVDPFYAIRVALLAKAVSIAGAVFAGWHAGVLMAVLSSPQISATGVWRSTLGLIGSLVMTVCGVIVERACKVPPDADTAAGSDASPA
jgi:hypothetical protein